MTAARIPLVARPSRKAFASSGARGFVFRSIRGLREKIWIASQPTRAPFAGAKATPPAMETWAPSSMGRPAVSVLVPKALPFGSLPSRGSTIEAPRLHDEVRLREVPVPSGEGVCERLPPAVGDPLLDDGIPHVQLDLAEFVERDDGLVDAHELPLEAVLFQEVPHRVLGEGPPGPPARLLPVGLVVATEDELPAGADGVGRPEHDRGGHAQVAHDKTARDERPALFRRLPVGPPHVPVPAEDLRHH